LIRELKLDGCEPHSMRELKMLTHLSVGHACSSKET
jgi:hypothetical protein